MNRGDLATAEFPKAQELGAALDEKFGGASPEEIQAFFEQAEVAVGEQGAAVPVVGDWHAMLLTNPARGEAQATVDAFLVGQKEFESNTAYVALGGLRDRRQDRAEGPTRSVRPRTRSGCCSPPPAGSGWRPSCTRRSCSPAIHRTTP